MIDILTSLHALSSVLLCLVDLPGFEPGTSRLSGERSKPAELQIQNESRILACGMKAVKETARRKHPSCGRFTLPALLRLPGLEARQ